MGRLLNPKSSGASLSGSSSSSSKKQSSNAYYKQPTSNPASKTISEKYPKGIAKATDGVLRYKDGSLGSPTTQAYYDWNYGRQGGDQDYRNLTANPDYQKEYDRLSSLKPGDSVWGSSGGSSSGSSSSMGGSSKYAASAAYDAYNLRAEAERSKREQEASRRANYDSSTGNLGGQKRDALTEAYIRNQQAKESFPQMSQLVGGGGASESSMMQMGAQYGNERNATEQAYTQAISALESDYNSGLAADASQYYDRIAGISAQQQQEQLAREQMALQIAESQKDRDFTESQTLAARAEARRIAEEQLARQMGRYSGGGSSYSSGRSSGGSSGRSSGGGSGVPDTAGDYKIPGIDHYVPDTSYKEQSVASSWSPSGIRAYVEYLTDKKFTPSEIAEKLNAMGLE